MVDLDRVHRSIGEANGKLDLLVGLHRDLAARMDSQDRRIRSLEVFRAKFKGVLAVFTVIGSLVTALFTKKGS